MFQKEREGIRTRAREKIAEIQAQNRKSYDKKRKEATRYEQEDMIAIKQVQTDPQLKTYLEVSWTLPCDKSTTE